MQFMSFPTHETRNIQPHFSSFAGRLSNALFRYDAVGYEELCTKLRQSGMTEARIEELMKQYLFLRAAGVMHEMHDGEAMIENLMSAFNDFVCTGLFRDGLLAEMEKLIAMIKSG